MADHYDAEANEGDIDMALFSRRLNSRWGRRRKLGRVFEQAGRTHGASPGAA
ncbi:hypothetical protein BH24ACT26_BH24ACT26_05830 [soil metagenome]|jgi:hypothetical protein